MTSHTRKLIAALLLLAFSALFFTLVIVFGSVILPGKPVYVELGYYFLTCLIWMYPSGLLIRWAQRPRW